MGVPMGSQLADPRFCESVNVMIRVPKWFADNHLQKWGRRSVQQVRWAGTIDLAVEVMAVGSLPDVEG